MNCPVAGFKRKRVQTTTGEQVHVIPHMFTQPSGKPKTDDDSPISKRKKQVCTDVSKIGIYNCSNVRRRTIMGMNMRNIALVNIPLNCIFAKYQVCIKTYSTQNGLRTHCRTIHGDELTCSICKTLSLSLQALEEHKKGHDTGKHQCQGCHRAFTRSNDHFKHWRYSCPNNPNKYHKCKHCVRVRNGEENYVRLKVVNPASSIT